MALDEIAYGKAIKFMGVLRLYSDIEGTIEKQHIMIFILFMDCQKLLM